MKKFAISNIDDIRNALKESQVMLFGVGGFPSTRSEVWPFVPDMEVICLNKTGEYDSVAEKVKVTYFPKENFETGEMIKKPEELLKNENVVEHIKHAADGKKVGIYLYKSTPGIDAICQEHGWQLIGNPGPLFDRNSSKLELYKILDKLGFSREYMTFTFEEFDQKFPEAFHKFGKKIVVQMLDQGGGRGTLFFDDPNIEKARKKIEERLELIKEDSKGKEFVASKFISGPDISIGATVTRDNGTISSYCQYQLIDIKETMGEKNDATGTFCGHDWSLSKNIPPHIHEQAQILAEKIGEELRKRNHLGIFGIDFIWDKENNKVVPLEINPRILGTFPTTVYVQLQKGEVPLVAFHILDFFNIPYEIASPSVYRQDAEREGAHLLLFNTFPYDVMCSNTFMGGVYSLEEDDMKFLRLGTELRDIENNDEFIITEGVPVPGKVYKRNRKILKVIAKTSLAQDDGRALNTWGKKVAGAVYKKLNLECHEEK